MKFQPNFLFLSCLVSVALTFSHDSVRVIRRHQVNRCENSDDCSLDQHKYSNPCLLFSYKDDLSSEFIDKCSGHCQNHSDDPFCPKPDSCENEKDSFSCFFDCLFKNRSVDSCTFPSVFSGLKDSGDEGLGNVFGDGIFTDYGGSNHDNNDFGFDDGNNNGIQLGDGDHDDGDDKKEHIDKNQDDVGVIKTGYGQNGGDVSKSQDNEADDCLDGDSKGKNDAEDNVHDNEGGSSGGQHQQGSDDSFSDGNGSGILNPCKDDPGCDECKDYCQSHPGEEGCAPSNPCKDDPDCDECKNYCQSHPDDSFCPISNDYHQD